MTIFKIEEVNLIPREVKNEKTYGPQNLGFRKLNLKTRLFNLIASF